MIYQTIYDLLKVKLQTVADIKSIDWFNDQYNNTETDDAEIYPAVYVEFPTPMNWLPAGNKMQQSEADITLHIVNHYVTRGPSKALALVQEVFKAINGEVLFDGDGNQITTELIRSTTHLNTRNRGLKVFEMSFKTEVFDISGMDQVITIGSGVVNVIPDVGV